MNLQKFCPKCGKETDELLEGLCKKCFKSENDLVKFPEKIEIMVCGMCGKWKDRGKWREGDFRKFLKEKIKDEMKTSNEINHIKITLEEQDYGFKAITEVKGKINGKLEDKSEGETKLKIKKETCKYCGRRKSGYHEAVIQIREASEDETEKIIEIVKKTVRKTKDKMGFISDVQRADNGLNLYIGSKSFANKIARNVEGEFDVERKDTYSLVTKKEGQDVYRNTTLLSFD